MSSEADDIEDTLRGILAAKENLNRKFELISGKHHEQQLK
jgi:hypothetical protein